MRRQAKESSAGSTEGSGNSRGLFRRAFATRGISSRFSGSGAPSHRLALLSLLALTAIVAFGTSTATAAAPTVTLNSVDNPTYATVDIEGEIDPMGEPITWFVEKSTDGENWEGTPLGNFIDGSQVSGPQPVKGTVEGLTAGQHYFFRLVGINNNGGSETRSAEPYPAATTESIPAPTVTIDPVTDFSATTAHFVGHIDPNSPAGNPAAANVDWHFECEPECPNVSIDSSPTPNPVPADTAEHAVSGEATGLEPNTEYNVRLIGNNAGPSVSAGPVEFTTVASAPEVQTLPAFAIRGGTEALVGGSINPRNSATTYWVEYGTTTAYGQKVPATPADAGSGGQLEYFTERLTGLTPSTVYHVRLVAENSSGDKSEGVDQNFETAPSSEAIAQDCPNASLRVENNSTALPECRAYEQVSPVDKNGFNVGQLPRGRGEESYVASTDGSKISFLAPGAFADSKSAFIGNPYLGMRTQDGWAIHALSLPAPTTGGGSNLYFRITWATPDLRYVAIKAPTTNHLAPGDFPGNLNFYLEDTLTGDLATLSAGTIPPLNAVMEAVGGSVDGKTVYFESSGPLLPEAPVGVISLYEWSENELQLASVLPNGEPSPSGGSTGGFGYGHTYVSENGSRLIFNVENEQLYLRDKQHTSESVSRGFNFLTGATPDLRSIFFVSNLALTPDAADDHSAKLYRFDADSKTTTLISPNAPDGGNVKAVRGVSPDGSYVYFRSQSRYLPGQGLSGQPGFPETNLYLWHDGEISFIASERHPPEDTLEANKFRVSPDGRYVSFESADRLTAYDNTDATPGLGGETRADTEVYIFDAQRKRLTCVSCNPSGEPPSGTAEGADAGSTFPDQEYDSRNPQKGVGDDGHIFFNSRDALISTDVNGVQDVYEWRGGAIHLISTGTGSEPASYADASASGDDVFLTTIQRLVSSDRDALSDLYDARVNGGFVQPAERSPCESTDTCHGQESRAGPEPNLSSPATAPERKADSARLRFRKALRECNHKPKKKRARCRKAAKKRFKNASTGRAHR